MNRELRLPPHYDFAGTLGPLCQRRYDPAARLSGTELWWTCRTPDGPATLHLRRYGDRLSATGYGPGAEWVTGQADAIAGLRDDVDGFTELVRDNEIVREAWHRSPGLRLARTGRLFVHLVPTILAQKVTGVEAWRGYTKMVRHFGEAAPGPQPDLLLPPDPAAVAAAPYWVFHPFGVEARRADALRRVAAEAARLGYGDPDAVTVGDYHIPHQVVYALTGAPRAGSRVARPGQLSPADARMLELLEPFRGQRARVCQVLLATAVAPPRYGPRMPVRSFAHF